MEKEFTINDLRFTEQRLTLEEYKKMLDEIYKDYRNYVKEESKKHYKMAQNARKYSNPKLRRYK